MAEAIVVKASLLWNRFLIPSGCPCIWRVCHDWHHKDIFKKVMLSSASFWGNFCLRISRGNKSAGTTTGADGASSQGQLMGLNHDRHKGFKVGFLVDTMMPLSLTSNWIFSHASRRVKRWSVIPSHHDFLRQLNLSKSNSWIRMKFPRSKDDKTGGGEASLHLLPP